MFQFLFSENRSRNRILAFLGLLIIAFALGYWVRGNDPEYPEGNAVNRISALVTEPDQQTGVYVCPMMCIPPRARSGICPVCGMDLVCVSSEGEKTPDTHIRLSPAGVSAAGITVVPVERRPVSAEVRLFGEIDYDPAHTGEVTAYMPGVIDRVYVRRAGQFVRWGNRLFDIYSPDLYATELQLVDILQHIPQFYAFQTSPYFALDAPVQVRSKEGNKDLSAEEKEAMEALTGIRAKLRILGLPKRDIDELMQKAEPTGIAGVYAPMYGVVVSQNASEGTFVNTGTSIFTLADPQFVWARLEAYESDFPWIRKGQKALFTVDAYPGEVFEGQVVYLDPIVFDSSKRTFKVGVQFPDKGGRLRAGMLVRATIFAEISAAGEVHAPGITESAFPLAIPVTAPLLTGKRAVVYVSVPEESGTFEAREVVLGPRGKEYYIVREGLKEGERVVINGNFKIDSAAQILAKKSLLSLDGDGLVTTHQTPGGSEVMERHYLRERMQSREENIHHETEDEDALRNQPGRPSDGSPRREDTIRRRLPGGYGDTTRENPSSLYR